MLVFLSHPLHGKSEEEIRRIRVDAFRKLKDHYGDDIRLIDNYRHSNAPENAGRLWHLGHSIQQMENADAIYFCDDWENAKGCRVERLVAEQYGFKILK